MADPKKNSESNKHVNAARMMRAAFIISLVGFSVGILILVLTGFHSRYLADDYCYSGNATNLGLFNGFWTLYTTWSGRYSAIFFLQIFGFWGRFFPAILPALILVGLSFSLNWLVTGLMRLRGSVVSGLLSWNLALGTVFFLYWLAPNRYQVLFWMNGSVSYSFPILFLITALAWILDFSSQKVSSSKKWDLVLIGILLLISSGFSETNAVFQVSLLGVLWIWSFLIKTPINLKVFRRYLCIGFWISIIGMLLVIIAPGNKVRQSLLPPSPGFVEFIKLSIQFGTDFLQDTLFSSPLPFAVIFLWVVVITVIQRYSREDAIRFPVKSYLISLCGILVTACLLAIAICSPSVYAQTAYPEARARTSGVFMLVICFLFLGEIAGNLLATWNSRFQVKINNYILIMASIILCLISIYPFRVSFLLQSDLHQASTFSTNWDSRFLDIQQRIIAGETSPIVKVIDSQHGIMEISEDPTNFVNRCAAQYFGLETIAAH
jgi:hypothetical protein